MPKAITFEHHQFFAGIRTRLSVGRDSERVLSALPHSHSAGIAFPMYYIMIGSPVLIMADLSGEAVLAQAEIVQADDRHRISADVCGARGA